MEFLMELVLELILEGSISISSNKKISKWIRYPLIVIIILFFLSVIGLVFLTGILVFKYSVLLSMLFIAIGAFLLVASIIKFKKLYLNKKDLKN